MKIFITGADGLLGSNLVREILGRGWSVKALIQPGCSAATLNDLFLEKVDGDLLDNSLSLSDAMDGCDAAIHCAAVTDLWADPNLVRQVNLEGTRRILEACLATGSVRRLIFIGSASSFQPGPIEQPGTEEGNFPQIYQEMPYVQTKHEAAELVRRYVRERGLDAVIVAPTFLLGPYDARPSGGELVQKFLQKNLRFATPGGRCFAYAPDVAKAVTAALESGRTGETYILGGENLTYLDFFNRVTKAAGRKPPTRILPASLVLCAGYAASLLEKLTRKRMLINTTICRSALVGAYYSSQKAVNELGMTLTPVETAIEDAIGSLIRCGHLESKNNFFKGKVALITGASRGVGFAVARELVLRGTAVVISARGKERLFKSRTALERLGGRVISVTGDVGVYEDARRMVEAAVENFGRLDILINNAGVSMRGRFDELSPAVCEQVAHTNLIGSIHPSRAAVEHLTASRGHLLFVSSIAGIMGLPGASIYCAAKRALSGLAESLRIELIPKGVHVGVVHLGFTEHDPEKRIIAADGSLVPPDRPAHFSQVSAAQQIIRMLEKRRKQVTMTPIGKLGRLVYRFFPGFVERAILWAQKQQSGVYKRFS